MKILLVAGVVTLTMPHMACALDSFIGSGTTCVGGYCGGNPVTCIASLCNSANNAKPTGTGIEIASGGLTVTCNGNSGTCSYAIPSYRCKDGYYGSNVTKSSGCTVCPSNATCTAGNNKVFICDIHYYQDGTKCTACQGPGVNGGAGAISATACFLYDVGSEKRWRDETGLFSVSGPCFYSTTEYAPPVLGWSYAP